MPLYVYGCTKDREHPTQEIVHGLLETVDIRCEVCGHAMKRIPQLFRQARRPADVLAEKLEKRFADYKRGKRHEQTGQWITGD